MPENTYSWLLSCFSQVFHLFTWDNQINIFVPSTPHSLIFEPYFFKNGQFALTLNLSISIAYNIKLEKRTTQLWLRLHFKKKMPWTYKASIFMLLLADCLNSFPNRRKNIEEFSGMIANTCSISFSSKITGKRQNRSWFAGICSIIQVKCFLRRYGKTHTHEDRVPMPQSPPKIWGEVQVSSPYHPLRKNENGHCSLHGIEIDNPHEGLQRIRRA